MPFVAKGLSGERIDITKLEKPKTVLKSGEVFCQQCGAPMIVTDGSIIRAHFRHYAECNTRYDSHPESQEHRDAKVFLRDHLAKEFSEYTDATIELEVAVEMDWRAKGRIADLMATFPNGWRVAHEIQLASITIEHLNERSSDYRRAGIDVIWWLGNHADTDTNRHWCIRNQGFCLILNHA